MSDMLTIEDLVVERSGRAIVAGASLAVPAQGIVAVVGPSGAGKSTILRAIAGILGPGDKVRGRIRLGDRELDRLHIRERRRRIGLLLQEPVVFPTSLYRNLAIPLRDHGHRGTELEARIQAALRAVDLWETVRNRLHDSAEGLSGGERQRLALARLLCLEPEFVLLDEPTSALDAVHTQRLGVLLTRLATRHGLLLVSHDLGFAAGLAERIYVLAKVAGVGRIVESGPPEHLSSAPNHPVTAALVAAARATAAPLGPDTHAREPLTFQEEYR